MLYYRDKNTIFSRTLRLLEKNRIGLTVAMTLPALLYLIGQAAHKWELSSFNELSHKLFRWEIIMLSFTLATVNWLLRIYKWKSLVEKVRPTGFKEAAFQQMSASAWAFYMPFNAGEFVHKPLMTGQYRRTVKKVGIEQLTQMSATVTGGLAGAAVLFPRYRFILSVAAAALMTTSLLHSAFRRAFVLSLLRYLVFGFMFWWILSYLDGTRDFRLAAWIGVYYLAVSLLPLAPGWDLAVKSGMGIWIMEQAGIPSAVTLTAIAWHWSWNTFLPLIVAQVSIISYSIFGNSTKLMARKIEAQ